MKCLVLAFCVAVTCDAVRAQTPSWRPAPGLTQVPIWPGVAPGARPGPDSESVATAPNPVAGRQWAYIRNVSRPTLTVYSPSGKNTGAAIVVFPGGGYQILAIDLEGTEVCDWLTSAGITCVLLKYRVPRSGPSWDPNCKCSINPRPQPALEDAQRAVGSSVITPPTGMSTRTRSACSGSPPAVISWRRSARIFDRGCTPPSMPRTVSAAVRTSRWRCIRDISGFRAVVSSRSILTFTSCATPRRRSCFRPRRTASTTSTSRLCTTSR